MSRQRTISCTKTWGNNTVDTLINYTKGLGDYALTQTLVLLVRQSFF